MKVKLAKDLQVGEQVVASGRVGPVVVSSPITAIVRLETSNQMKLLFGAEPHTTSLFIPKAAFVLIAEHKDFE